MKIPLTVNYKCYVINLGYKVRHSVSRWLNRGTQLYYIIIRIRSMQKIYITIYQLSPRKQSNLDYVRKPLIKKKKYLENM